MKIRHVTLAFLSVFAVSGCLGPSSEPVLKRDADARGGLIGAAPVLLLNPKMMMTVAKDIQLEMGYGTAEEQAIYNGPDNRSDLEVLGKTGVQAGMAALRAGMTGGF